MSVSLAILVADSFDNALYWASFLKYFHRENFFQGFGGAGRFYIEALLALNLERYKSKDVQKWIVGNHWRVCRDALEWMERRARWGVKRVLRSGLWFSAWTFLLEMEEKEKVVGWQVSPNWVICLHLKGVGEIWRKIHKIIIKYNNNQTPFCFQPWEMTKLKYKPPKPLQIPHSPHPFEKQTWNLNYHHHH